MFRDNPIPSPLYKQDGKHSLSVGTRIKDSCGLLDEILCYQIKASTSGFKYRLTFTARQREIIERASKLEHVKMYLVKVDVSKFAENIFKITLERLDG